MRERIERTCHWKDKELDESFLEKANFQKKLTDRVNECLGGEVGEDLKTMVMKVNEDQLKAVKLKLDWDMS